MSTCCCTLSFSCLKDGRWTFPLLGRKTNSFFNRHSGSETNAVTFIKSRSLCNYRKQNDKKRRRIFCTIINKNYPIKGCGVIRVNITVIFCCVSLYLTIKTAKMTTLTNMNCYDKIFCSLIYLEHCEYLCIEHKVTYTPPPHVALHCWSAVCSDCSHQNAAVLKPHPACLPTSWLSLSR